MAGINALCEECRDFGYLLWQRHIRNPMRKEISPLGSKSFDDKLLLESVRLIFQKYLLSNLVSYSHSFHVNRAVIQHAEIFCRDKGGSLREYKKAYFWQHGPSCVELLFCSSCNVYFISPTLGSSWKLDIWRVRYHIPASRKTIISPYACKHHMNRLPGPYIWQGNMQKFTAEAAIKSI